jgi:hypothetical protein
MELDIKTIVGSSVEARAGVDIVSGPEAAVQGSLIDAAIVIDNGGRGGPTGTPVGWKNAIQIGYFNENNNNPISTGGNILTTFTGVATVLASGIDISGTSNGGAGFTYTGDFFKANVNNRWEGNGAIIATATGVNHDITRTDGGLIAIFENIGAAASVAVGSRVAAQQVFYSLYEAGTPKWEMVKETDNSYSILDVALSKKALTVGVTTPGQTVLGETGGSQLTLVPSGGAVLSAIATSGDGSGLYVCQNASDGTLYRKAACP